LGDPLPDHLSFEPVTASYCYLLHCQHVSYICFFSVKMPLQLSSQLSRLVRRDNRGQAPLNASVAPAGPSIDSDPDYNEPNVPTVVVDTDNSVFNGLN
jgi:hypothetical protein